MSSIALPSFLTQGNKAKQSEAKQYLGTYNKAQQAYYLENSKFVTDINQRGALGIGLPPETANYRYSFAPINEGKAVATIAIPNNNPSAKSYIAAVGLAYGPGATDMSTLSALCESKAAGAALDASAVTVVIGLSGTGGGEVSCNDAVTVAVK